MVFRARTMACSTLVRSFRISVTDAASAAMSVPEAMAMPTSACASAGASFNPSPAIATRRPSRCNDLIASTFPSGSTSAITSSMPTCFAIASAVARRSPLSITTCRPRRRSDETTA